MECSRAVLSGGHGAEPQAAGAIPRAAAGGAWTEHGLMSEAQRGGKEEVVKGETKTE
jgi:hypothetical protein